ncbi:hypothetical protein [Rhodococcus sp. CH91]|uniref:hypothetical protein n=1 Tax=Rhodococcus sp. CH91 TaxID=2910256 RepID=UPI001F4A6260|nr:hypothetical protein [Rhodococcus sp. CH91]
MTKFDDSLLDELLTRHSATLTTMKRVEPHRRRTTRPLAVAASALAVAGAVSAIALTGTDSPAYAVTLNADDTVTVSIEDVKAVDAANAELQRLGVRATAVAMTDDCSYAEPPDYFEGAEWDSPYAEGDSVIIGRDIPQGYTVLISVSGKPDRGLGFTAPVKIPAPSCVLDPASDPEQMSPPTAPR